MERKVYDEDGWDNVGGSWKEWTVSAMMVLYISIIATRGFPVLHTEWDVKSTKGNSSGRAICIRSGIESGVLL